MLQCFTTWFNRWCISRDELLMKQAWGDKPGEYRPRTWQELRQENPNSSSEEIDALYEWELFMWDEERVLD